MNSDYEIRKKMKEKQKRIKMQKRIIIFCMILIVIFIFFMGYICGRGNKKAKKENETVEVAKVDETVEIEKEIIVEEKPKKEEIDWRLILVNRENLIPEDYKFELSNIDKNLKFDSRAIGELNKMMNDIRKSGISNIWIQSSYRDIKLQEELYNNSVKRYMKQGKTEEEAKKITEIYINRPGSSEHNIGLAVDFNDVKETFEDTKAFKWLMKNAEDYGFILRYPKNKEDITKISYEPWHWRYVGKENAKDMNEKGVCLEEYVK